MALFIERIKQFLGISVLYGLNPNYAVEGEG